MTDMSDAPSYLEAAWTARLGVAPGAEPDGTLTVEGGVPSEVMRWLNGRCGGPRAHPTRDRTTVLPGGLPADDPAVRSRVEEVTDALAAAIRAVHMLDPTGCPATITTVDRIARATGPAALLDHVRRLAALTATRAAVSDVVTLGGARLDGITVDVDPAGRLVWHGLVEAASIAAGDPYRDFAAAARSLAAAYGPEVLPRFFELVGLAEPDPVRLELHAALDELGV